MSPYEAVQLSQRTSAFCRSSSAVTVWSVVYATVAEFSPAGSQAAAPPTASTASTTPAATRRPRGRRRIIVNAPMQGSLPLSRPSR